MTALSLLAASLESGRFLLYDTTDIYVADLGWKGTSVSSIILGQSVFFLDFSLLCRVNFLRLLAHISIRRGDNDCFITATAFPSVFFLDN